MSVRRVGVVGSRDYQGRQWFDIHFAGFLESAKDYDATIFITGGARGPDSWAEAFARKHKFPVKVHRADWEKHGRGAGMRRNTLIVKDSDYIIAFWDGKSRGTLDTMRKAKNAGKAVLVITEEGDHVWWNDL